MIILGINEEHDAGCAIVKDGQLLAAYEEERFSRKKQHNGQSDGMPINSLKAILKDFKLEPKDIDCVASVFPTPLYLFRQILKTFWQDKNPNWIFAPFFNKDFYGLGDYLYPLFYVTRKRYRLKKFLKENGFSNPNIIYTDHHVAHAASAYYCSNFNNALVLTLDGHGSGISGSVSIGKSGRLERKSIISKYNSVGLLYSTITAGLGFKAGRHEGKILGLAAFGDPSVYERQFKEMICCDGEDIHLSLMANHHSPTYPHFTSYKKIFKEKFEPWFNGKREDLCASLQKRVEEVVVEWVRNLVVKHDISNVAVAGGVFSNVKVNQKILEMDEVENLFVFPAMSDAGLAAGSALNAFYLLSLGEEVVTGFKDTYLGKSFDIEIEDYLNKAGLTFSKEDNIEARIAQLLSENKVICRYNSRTEFGPRALGNRSIIYNGKDKEVNIWLNKKLDRTEFMPFAPSVLFEDATKYFEVINQDQFAHPADFMTITFRCKDVMRTDCPAAVHIDNTARPQFVRKETNPSYHKIISEYKKLSGSSVIVNTSFNVHEEPIVNSPKDAIRSFLLTRLDALAIGDYLVLKENL